MNLVASIHPAMLRDMEQILRLSNSAGPEGKPREQLPDKLPDGYFLAFDREAKDPNQGLMVADADGAMIGTLHLTFLTYLAGAGSS
jgi:hypothetical protein